MVELPYATVDADNHYYEPVDGFTRHIERTRRTWRSTSRCSTGSSSR